MMRITTVLATEEKTFRLSVGILKDFLRRL